MQDLRLIGVHEDGGHLLLAGDDGTRYRLPIDDALRADVRPRREPSVSSAGGAQLRPRDVQALIRSGASAEETAAQAGWTVEKVHRYESPILAEREHIASLARRVSVRERTPGGAAGVQTVEARVAARLADRGVSADTATWDAWRRETGPWTVVAVFPAGGRERLASWHFDPSDRALTPLDDEARWLSGDEQEPVGGPIPAATTPRRRTRVYDVEAEGGLRPAERDPGPAGTGRAAGAADVRDPGEDAALGDEDGSLGDQDNSPSRPLDLMTAMRERSGARGRRSGRRTKRGKRETTPPTSPAHVPGAEDVPDDALPLEDIAYDPETMPPPPAAHGPHEDDPADTDPGTPTDADTVADTDETGRRAGHDGDHRERPAAVDRFEEPGLFDAVEETRAPDDPAGADAVEETRTLDDPAGADAADDAASLEQPEVAEEVHEQDVHDDAASPADSEVTEGAHDRGAVEGPGTAATVAAEPEQPQEPQQQEPQRGTPRRSTRKSGRPSVPSWDDIMFGSPRGER